MDLVAAQHRIDTLRGRGTSFTSIEDMIDGLALSDDAKAALWLYAWAHTPRRYQARVARQMLTVLGSD